MWDPKTGGTYDSCDVIWLQQMFYKERTDTSYAEVNVEPAENKTPSMKLK
jgi:hypothetical protein